MKVTFTERNDMLMDKYGHLLDEAKHFSGSQMLNELEENKMAVLIDNAVQGACRKYGQDYNEFTLRSLDEATTKQTDTGDIAYTVKLQLAMIGQIYPNMISREFVSLQPITQPNYKIFYNDFKRSDGTSLSSDIHARREYANNVEYDPTSPTDIQTVDMEVTSEDVAATTKKLKGNVTIEVEQDLLAYHGMNAMSLVTSNMGAELTREWDRTIIADLFSLASGGTAYFNKKQPVGISYEERKFWMETFYESILDVDNMIFKARYRRTNFLIVSADEATFMAKMKGFEASDIASDAQIIKTGGRYFAGTLANRWRVYVDPFITGEMLVGYNGAGNWSETGYVFSPYEMAYLTDAFTNPDTLVKTRAIMSRAARKCVIPGLYGKVIITNS